MEGGEATVVPPPGGGGVGRVGSWGSAAVGGDRLAGGVGFRGDGGRGRVLRDDGAGKER